MRIRREANAVEGILKQVETGAVEWIASDALVDEILQNPSIERRLENEGLVRLASQTVPVDLAVEERAADLAAVGYGAYDALHLATAEHAGADVLLTTDDEF